MGADVFHIQHPLVQHKLSIMRKSRTASNKFRALLKEIGMLMAYEVTRDLPITLETIETPLESMQAPFIEGKKLCVVSILRAGNGLLDSFVELVPSARIGHVGLYRDPETLQAVEYYFKVPELIQEREVIAVDPMLATGHSAIAAVERLKVAGAQRLRFVCLLAAPEGIQNFHQAHPDVPVYTAAIDRELNDHGYILPGLGDAGDRLYGTR